MQSSAKVSLLGVLFASGGILSSSSATAGMSCPPFFDFSKSTVVTNVAQSGGSFLQAQADITPEPQPQSAFGEAVLSACGEFGDAVDPAAVKNLADRFSPDFVKLLAREFPAASDSQIRTALFQSWTNANGFEHVFCGQPRINKVSGLHYSGRYLELQKKGALCRLENNILNEEVLPQNVYTIGVTTADGVVDRKKGFSIRQSAEDIFFEAARTYLRNCQAPSKDRRVCVTRFYKDDSFGSLFVCAPGRGIITFYPLASMPKDAVACK